jgi:hypothetical protein
MLAESQRHALKAVDEWNTSTGNYSDFITQMHRAWHYLLHAVFRRDKVDYHYRDTKTGRYVEVDGEPKAWDLERCLKQRYPKDNDPVRSNVELFVKLRNKVEHRYEHGLKIVTGGKAQALVINYENEVVQQFGPAFSMADKLRFPVFLQSLTSAQDLRAAVAKLPGAPATWSPATSPRSTKRSSTTCATTIASGWCRSSARRPTLTSPPASSSWRTSPMTSAGSWWRPAVRQP